RRTGPGGIPAYPSGPGSYVRQRRACLSASRSVHHGQVREQRARADRVATAGVDGAARCCHRVARRVQTGDRSTLAVEHAPDGVGPQTALGAEIGDAELRRMEGALLDRDQRGPTAGEGEIVGFVPATEVFVDSLRGQLVPPRDGRLQGFGGHTDLPGELLEGRSEE